MCVKNYVGYHCGHRDPEGTVMKTNYCRKPQRFDHEPACDAFTYRLHVRVDLRRPRESDFCPTCRDIREALWKEWTDTYLRWTRERLVPGKDQLETHKRIQNSLKHVEQRARQAAAARGPDHAVQDEYRARQDSILRPLERQIERIREANLAWRVMMRTAKHAGKVSKTVLDILETRRKMHSDLTRPAAYSVNALLERQGELLDELKKETEKAEMQEKYDSDPS